MSELYDVYFTGEIDENFSKKEVFNQLRTTMKASEAFLKKMFSGGSVCIKKGVTEQKAQALCKRLLACGAIAEYKAQAPQFELEIVEDTPPAPTSEEALVVAANPKEAYRSVNAQAGRDMPQVVVVDRSVIHSPPQAKGFSLVDLFMWFGGMFWVLLGVVFMLAFSPFPDGSIRRGLILGACFCLFGVYRIVTRRRMGV